MKNELYEMFCFKLVNKNIRSLKRTVFEAMFFKYFVTLTSKIKRVVIENTGVCDVTSVSIQTPIIVYILFLGKFRKCSKELERACMKRNTCGLFCNEWV